MVVAFGILPRPAGSRIGGAMRPVVRAVTVVASFALLGCSFSVPPVEPRPNVALPSPGPSCDLSLSEAVPDAFDVEAKNGVKGGSVEGWRLSLQRGFDNAFARFSGRSRATLELEMVDLEFVLAGTATPPSYVVTGPTTGVLIPGSSSAQAVVTFRGRWRIDGRDVAFADVARSKGVAAEVGDFDDLAESAIETMYEMTGRVLVAAIDGPVKEPSDVAPGAAAAAEPAPTDTP